MSGQGARSADESAAFLRELIAGAPPAARPTDEFLAMCGEFGVSFESGDLDRLGRYVSILLHVSERMNLTAIREPARAWVTHVFDALTLLPLLSELPAGAHVLDVGSGGGAPGIPLAIVLPDLKFSLLEATAKKAEYLKQACGHVGVDARVLSERAEALGQDRAYREKFDVVMARALGPMPTALELTAPFARVGDLNAGRESGAGGRVVLVKGEKADEELAASGRAMELLGVEHAGTIDTPTGRLVVFEKVVRSQRPYPRRDGEPKRAPLVE